MRRRHDLHRRFARGAEHWRPADLLSAGILARVKRRNTGAVVKKLWMLGGVAAICFSFTAGAYSQQAVTQRIPQFENEDVKVWKSVVLPNQPLVMHRHDHPRVIVALQGGTMKIVEQGGASEEHVWETGKAYWLPMNPPGTMHADVNAGDKPIEVMVVELENEH